MTKCGIIAVLFALTTWGGQALANNCATYLENAEEARTVIVSNFTTGNYDRLEQGISDLVFWCNYVNVKCGKGGLIETPITWLSQKMTESYESTSYKIGFLLWLHEKEADPISLVGGRRFSE